MRPRRSEAEARGDDRWWALPIFTVRRFYHTQFQPPPGLRFSYLADSQSLDRMLLDGELDVCSFDRHLHEVLARDLWAYGIAAARPALDTLLRYLETQELLARPVHIDELFAPSTLGL